MREINTLNTPENPENENYESTLSLKKGMPVFMYRFLDGRIKIFQHRSIQVMSSGLDAKSLKINGIYFSFIPGEEYPLGLHIKYPA